MPISATAAISPAFTRTGQVLFKPSNFKKWCAIGVAAWLTLLGEGGGFNGNFNSSSSSGRGPGAGGPNPFQPVIDWMQAHVALVIVLAGVGLFLGLVLYAIYLWLNSRGQFMLMEHIVTNEVKVKAAWAKYKSLGNSLFRFRLLLSVMAFVLVLLLVGAAALIAMPDWSLSPPAYHFSAASGWAIGLLAAAMLLSLPFIWVFGSLFQYLVIPVMYVRELPAWAACKVTWSEIFRPNVGQCLTFFVLMIVAGIVKAIWVTIATLIMMVVTCCVLAIVAAVPVLGAFAKYPVAVAALPPIVFERAFHLHFLSQFGNEYMPAWSLPDANPTAFEVIPTQTPPDAPAPPTT